MGVGQGRRGGGGVRGESRGEIGEGAEPPTSFHKQNYHHSADNILINEKTMNIANNILVQIFGARIHVVEGVLRAC